MQMNLLSIQPLGPAPGDPANVISQYLLEHPILTGTFLSHLDMAAVAYLTPERQIKLISVPAQAVPPALGAQRLVRIHGCFASTAAPVEICTLAVASSYALFAADYTTSLTADYQLPRKAPTTHP